MIVNSSNLGQFFTGLKTTFNKALDNAQTHYKDVAMIVPSATAAEKYGWLADVPGIREWIGPRIVHGLAGQSMQIVNQTWESTVAIPREAVEDDQYGIYTPMVSQMAMAAAVHPDELIFKLLGEGFVTACYDSQNFFDTEHQNGVSRDGLQTPVFVSNMYGSGVAPPWFLLDCSQAVKPLVFQTRRPITFIAKTKLDDDNVFNDNEFVYGCDARYSAGYGLWQLAFACTDPLTPYNYAIMRAKMMSQVSPSGRPLGVKPTHLVTLPGNESAALRILRADTVDATTNEWKSSADPVITQFLRGARNATAVWDQIIGFQNANDQSGYGLATTANGLPPGTGVIDFAAVEQK